MLGLAHGSRSPRRCCSGRWPRCWCSSLACGPLGVWVLLYRQAYAAESISHGMLPGLVLAALAGARSSLGAAAGVLVAAAGIALVARDERLGAEIGVAVCVSALLGLGALLALAPASPPRLQELLFGDLLGVTGRDLAVAGALVGGVALALAGGHRVASRSSGFDRAAARALGARPARWEPALLAVLAVTTVAAVQGLGSLLLVALVLAPAAAALVLTRRLPAALALAAALAALSGAGRPAALLPPGSRGRRIGGAVRRRARRGRADRPAGRGARPLTSPPSSAKIAGKWSTKTCERADVREGDEVARRYQVARRSGFSRLDAPDCSACSPPGCCWPPAWPAAGMVLPEDDEPVVRGAGGRAAARSLPA